VTVIKICGIRALEEGRSALESGADWLGFVFYPPSPRYITPERARGIIQALRDEMGATWRAVGVWVNPDTHDVQAISATCALNFIQLSGHESPEDVRRVHLPVLKAVHVAPGHEEESAEIIAANRFGADRYLLDTHREGRFGGTGETFDWEPLRSVSARCVVAGGLQPDNVRVALDRLVPFGVDVSSGVEYPGGGKDPLLVGRFVQTVRQFDHERAQVSVG
jgi:phosphoribosylanthranilate isomerase